MNEVAIRSLVDPTAGKPSVRLMRAYRTLGAIVEPLRLFAGARDGVAAIEVGLLAFPFFFLCIGVLAVGFMAYCHATLDYATQRSARQIMVGSAQSQSMTLSMFTSQVLCPYLPAAIFDCTKIVVNLKVVPETWEPTAWANYVGPTSLIVPPLSNAQNTFCLGAGNTYQILEVLYPLPVYLSLFSSAPNVTNNQFVVMSAASFKTEPFQGSAPTAPGC